MALIILQRLQNKKNKKETNLTALFQVTEHNESEM